MPACPFCRYVSGIPMARLLIMMCLLALGSAACATTRRSAPPVPGGPVARKAPASAPDGATAGKPTHLPHPSAPSAPDGATPRRAYGDLTRPHPPIDSKRFGATGLSHPAWAARSRNLRWDFAACRMSWVAPIRRDSTAAASSSTSSRNTGSTSRASSKSSTKSATRSSRPTSNLAT